MTESPIIALAGRRIDAEDAPVARFPLRNAKRVGEQLQDAFEERRPRFLVCAAACGADLLALEACGKLGIPRRVVLPSLKDRFREGSVVDRPGQWGQRFDRVIEEVEREGGLLLREFGNGDEAYRAANRAILEEAERLGEGPYEAWIVWNGEARGETDLTLHFANEARARAFQVREFLTI